jgi:cystathionine beta-lyase family protein involved in aluminum resistance
MTDTQRSDSLFSSFSCSSEDKQFLNHSYNRVLPQFSELESIQIQNEKKILDIFRESRLESAHFQWNTGYGYDDIGREKVEEIYAKFFRAQAALVRPTIASGTHALALTLRGLLLPGDEVVSITGTPYDTLLKVLGISGDEPGNLSEFDIGFRELPLSQQGQIQISKLVDFISATTKVVMIQRSTGYSVRPAIRMDEMAAAIAAVKEIRSDLIVMVDNCYGEFVETTEPIEVGADLAVGSLIKNPGGGLALSGGYVAGTEVLIDRIANFLTAPGVGKECGLTFGQSRSILQGLFFAPQVVSNALKSALLFASVFEDLGYETYPNTRMSRGDIVQTILLGNQRNVEVFCETIQKCSPVDSFVRPIPWEMPGYTDPVIMAAGTFVQGSSIELSADAPMREPFAVYVQGGLIFTQALYAVAEMIAYYRQ